MRSDSAAAYHPPAGRRALRRGLLLATPLLAFLILFFLIPIAGIFVTSVNSPDFADAFPRTAAALERWDGASIPDEAAYAALVADMRVARENQTIAAAATRLNRETGGLRSVLMRAARHADRLDAEAPRRDLVALDPRWGELSTWHAIDAVSGPWTARFVLAALDLRQDDHGGIARADPDHQVYLRLMARTIWMSVVVTALCLLVGYPMAYAIATAPGRLSRLLLFLVLLPFWMSVLVRTAAWVILLQSNGVLNGLLIWLGLVDTPIPLIFNRTGVYIAMVYVLLPFMVLPLHSVMRSVPGDLMRAAASLGARPLNAFFTVYLPQTLPGLGAGCLLVFIISVGFYVTPALVGGPRDQMLSSTIFNFALETAHWGMAAAIALLLMLVVALFFPLYARVLRGGAVKVQ
ncbi:MAG: ABC transporter permease [Alphaproteobacteria bacterium]|nr:ABC transporter permease [Alphaproteobacteria bacterium]